VEVCKWQAGTDYNQRNESDDLGGKKKVGVWRKEWCGMGWKALCRKELLSVAAAQRDRTLRTGPGTSCLIDGRANDFVALGAGWITELH
jgi:hypothetical protein